METQALGLTEPLDFEGDTPVYEQIKNRIKFAIARGAFGPNDQLPSVRALAGGLLVNPNTVVRVYRELEQEGLLWTRKGKGVFVAPHSGRRCRRDRVAIVLDKLSAALEEARRADLDEAELEALWRQLKAQPAGETGEAEGRE